MFNNCLAPYLLSIFFNIIILKPLLLFFANIKNGYLLAKIFLGMVFDEFAICVPLKINKNFFAK